jgi:transposase
MIVIGVDTHKRQHTLVALDAGTGASRGQLTIPSSVEGTLDALRFAAGLDDVRVWAVEDCRHVSGRLERGLLASGDPVVRVAPGLTESSRRAVREPGKSDPIDATAIARAALREGVDTLPVAFLDQQAHEIRLLNDYRDQLVNERVRLASRLRWHLVQIAPELEAQIRPAGLIGPRIRAKVTRGLARLPRTPQARVARAIHKRICDIYREKGERRSELNALIEAHCPQLLDEHGCGSVTAAIIGHTAGAKRFPDRRVLRPPRRHRPNPRQLRQHPTPPAAPRRRPPTQPSAAHHRALPSPHRPSDPHPPRPPTQRRQNQKGSNPLPQTPPRPTHLATALHNTTPRTNPTATALHHTHQHHHRRCSNPHAMRPLKPANSDTPLT